MDNEEREQLNSLLEILQQRLRFQEQKEAVFGFNTPAEVQIEISEIRNRIARIRSELAGRPSVQEHGFTEMMII